MNNNKFFSYSFKKFINNKNTFKMFSTITNTNKSLINFSNLYYFNKVNTLINSMQTIKSIQLIRLEQNIADMDNDDCIESIVPFSSGNMMLNNTLICRQGK